MAWGRNSRSARLLVSSSAESVTKATRYEPCACAAPDAWPADVPAADPCAAGNSCGSCTPLTGCGWCGATARCQRITSRSAKEASACGAIWACFPLGLPRLDGLSPLLDERGLPFGVVSPAWLRRRQRLRAAGTRRDLRDHQWRFAVPAGPRPPTLLEHGSVRPRRCVRGRLLGGLRCLGPGCSCGPRPTPAHVRRVVPPSTRESARFKRVEMRRPWPTRRRNRVGGQPLTCVIDHPVQPHGGALDVPR